MNPVNEIVINITKARAYMRVKLNKPHIYIYTWGKFLNNSLQLSSLLHFIFKSLKNFNLTYRIYNFLGSHKN